VLNHLVDLNAEVEALRLRFERDSDLGRFLSVRWTP
jgi:hypothetical protein